MNKFALSAKAKSDLIKIAKYTQLTWGQAQRNSYLKILDNSFQLLANDPKIGINCDYIREGYSKYPLANHVIYYKGHKENQILIVRILHKSMDVNRAL
ncbi:type II toxin-antitoxin system RelE/ParE family toxin [Pseudoalteromonas sp. S3431]|uniref:type II toxin-antitoxin system RelE/ParE family toxin n=1 Tax=Pseudoalteromonas sp. S3431 TaxID=579537 RepID=UPI00049EEE88|nr:type II toxin-antitoxin system RelE/ParE family toxin [Pseudoalteromonas sp. S3431]KDC51969.1 plasmid stabilization protein ParE [Pseudoalteromonas sp. S3431]